MSKKSSKSIDRSLSDLFYNKFPYLHKYVSEYRFLLILRILIVSFIILLFFNGIDQGILYLILVVFIFIFIYIIQNRKMNTVIENFQSNTIHTIPKKDSILYYLPKKLDTGTDINIKYFSKPKQQYESKDFCNKPFDDEEVLKSQGWNSLNFDQSYVSKNKLMVGGANPKTTIAPVLAPRSHDLEEWRDNEFVTLSLINSENRSEIYESGYTENYMETNNNCNKRDYLSCRNNNISNNDVNEYYTSNSERNNNEDSKYIQGEGLVEYLHQRELLDANREYTDPEHRYEPEEHLLDEAQYTTLIGDYCALKQDNPMYNLRGELNTEFGYNRENLKYNIPVNANTSRCDKTDRMKNINKNIYTQTIQPGSYMMNEIIEPLDANIGISLNEPMHKISCGKDKYGNTIWKMHDPNFPPPSVEIPEHEKVENAIAEFNVYDPRSSGYGSSYRNYNHDVTGQPRFMYDDVDAIIQPNYITRSNIDFERYADSYGPKTNRGGNEYNARIREMAENSWVDNSLAFREELQMRSLRKFNARNIQQRIAPIRTTSANSCMNRCK